MASDDATTAMANHSSMHDNTDVDEEVVVEDHHHHHLHHRHNHLSRLSMCTSEGFVNDEYIGQMSRLSITIEGSDGEDADGELSDKEVAAPLLSSDSDIKEPSCFSLPATPPRRRIQRGVLTNQSLKEYNSENEAQSNKSVSKRNQRRRRSSSISFRERWIERSWWGEKKRYSYGRHAMEDEMNNNNRSISGESECLVITRPKGGKKSLCMDLEEVKACKELGFELESDMMLELPGGVSMSCSSSGGNSPIANWRISSPGDNPRDVKARLKAWAQAVAITSTSRHVT